ncbi:MAG: hypothetical protein KY439_01170 [Actinobacteria bacterium]|nr:hypothetical protein [Actinomycetota bacterium]
MGRRPIHRAHAYDGTAAPGSSALCNFSHETADQGRSPLQRPDVCDGRAYDGLTNVARTNARLGVELIAPEAPSIPAGNFRGRYNANLAKQRQPRLPDNWDAHHRIPQMYRDRMDFADFHFDAPDNILGVPGNRAGTGVQNIHNQVTQRWGDFARSNPNASRAEIEAFAERIDVDFEGYWWRR